MDKVYYFGPRGLPSRGSCLHQQAHDLLPHFVHTQTQIFAPCEFPRTGTNHPHEHFSTALPHLSLTGLNRETLSFPVTVNHLVSLSLIGCSNSHGFIQPIRQFIHHPTPSLRFRPRKHCEFGLDSRDAFPVRP